MAAVEETFGLSYRENGPGGSGLTFPRRAVAVRASESTTELLPSLSRASSSGGRDLFYRHPFVSFLAMLVQPAGPTSWGPSRW